MDKKHVSPWEMECLNQIFLYVLAAVGKFVSILVAAGVGAHFAFKYRQHEDEKRRRKDQITSLRIAQSAVHSQWSALAGYVLDYRKYAEFNNKRLDVRTFIRAPVVSFVNLPSIAFLFEGQHADLIQQVMLAEGAYRTAMLGVSEREAMAREFLKNAPRNVVNKDGQIFGTIVDVVQAELFFGITASTLASIEDAISRCNSVFDALRDAGKQIFPGEKFLMIEDLPKL